MNSLFKLSLLMVSLATLPTSPMDLPLPPLPAHVQAIINQVEKDEYQAKERKSKEQHQDDASGMPSLMELAVDKSVSLIHAMAQRVTPRTLKATTQKIQSLVGTPGARTDLQKMLFAPLTNPTRWNAKQLVWDTISEGANGADLEQDGSLVVYYPLVPPSISDSRQYITTNISGDGTHRLVTITDTNRGQMKCRIQLWRYKPELPHLLTPTGLAEQAHLNAQARQKNKKVSLGRKQDDDGSQKCLTGKVTKDNLAAALKMSHRRDDA